MRGVTSWRWPQWFVFVLALLALASYFGLISTGRVDQELDRLAARSDRELLTRDTGRGEALFIVFAFLLLTPVAVGLVACVPMFASATAGAFLQRLIRLPEVVGTLLFWIGFAVLAYFTVDAWLPWMQQVAGLIARAFFIALQTS
ncbi:MAG TPA: hypothetical protein VGV13_18135 [Methylomirabilota bacterium]|nr:hypothetical protein [Methylomirabilota bacterium]